MTIFCNQLFLALTDVALTDASVKVVLHKRCKFCPVFFALSTTEEASHSWGETFGDQKRHRLVCGKLLENSPFNQLNSSRASWLSWKLCDFGPSGTRFEFHRGPLFISVSLFFFSK